MRTRSWLGTAITVTTMLCAVLFVGGCFSKSPEITFESLHEGDEIGVVLNSVLGKYEGASKSEGIWLVAMLGEECWPIGGPASKRNGNWQLGEVSFPDVRSYRLWAVLADAEGANELEKYIGKSEGITCWPRGVEPVNEILITVLAPTSTPTPTPSPTATPRAVSEITPLSPTPTPTPGRYTISGRVLATAEEKYVGMRDILVRLYSNPDGCESQSTDEDYRNDQVQRTEELSGDEQLLLGVSTQEDGLYTFRGRSPGCYAVQVVPRDDQGSATSDIQEAPVKDRDVHGLDFIIEPRLGSISIHIWLDENRDAKWQEGETAESTRHLNLWRDANCDGWPENQVAPLLPQFMPRFVGPGEYSFENLPLESCYVVELQAPDRAVLTTGEANVHICLLQACLEDEPNKSVDFGYYIVPSPPSTPVPSLVWWRVDSSACDDHQMITLIEKDPGGTNLKIYGEAKRPPSAVFDKYELHYALEGCTSLESCYSHLVTENQPSRSPLYSWPLPDGLEEGQKVLLRLRVVSAGFYDDGCKAWLIFPGRE